MSIVMWATYMTLHDTKHPYPAWLIVAGMAFDLILLWRFA